MLTIYCSVKKRKKLFNLSWLRRKPQQGGVWECPETEECMLCLATEYPPIGGLITLVDKYICQRGEGGSDLKQEYRSFVCEFKEFTERLPSEKVSKDLLPVMKSLSKGGRGSPYKPFMQALGLLLVLGGVERDISYGQCSVRLSPGRCSTCPARGRHGRRAC